MTDKELLASISKIMDSKIKALEKRMDTFDEKLDKVEERLSARIELLDKKIDHVEQKLSAEIARLDSEIQRIDSNITLLNMQIDTIVIPRLNEIENCYISTSERYIRETDKFIAFDTDLSVVKDVVNDHSKRLSAIGA